MKQLCNVVMLPTEKASNIIINTAFNDGSNKDKLFYSNESKVQCANIRPQHLYITSDEEIKEGDWYYNPAGNNFAPDMRLVKCESLHEAIACRNEPVCSKVIATTDKSLTIETTKADVANVQFSKHSLLPQIPESFIKVFVESNDTIKEVLVDYEERWKDLGDRGDGKHIYETNHLVLKTRPDNTIIISQARTYTKDEVEQLCNSSYVEGMNAQKFINDLPTPRVRFKKWLEDNL